MEKETNYRVEVMVKITAPDPNNTYIRRDIAKAEQGGETTILLKIPEVAQTLIEAAIAQVGIAVQTEDRIAKQTRALPEKAVEPEVETESENE